MGVDLTLWFEEYEDSGLIVCTDSLSVDRCYALFERIRLMKPGQVPVGHTEMLSASGDSRAVLSLDAYGQRLTVLCAAEIAQAFTEWGQECERPDNLGSVKNHAIRVYLCALEKRTRVILFWH